MMLRITGIFCLIYFLIGTLILPLGNFASLPNLPEMYRHCVATEDKDMDAADFITDHLVNIDCIFDKHEEGDEQKPHQASAFNNTLQQLFVNLPQVNWQIQKPLIVQSQNISFVASVYHSEYRSEVLRPPIA